MAPETNNYHPPSDRLKFDSFTSVPEVSIAQAPGFPEKYFQADKQAFGKVHVNFAIPIGLGSIINTYQQNIFKITI